MKIKKYIGGEFTSRDLRDILLPSGTSSFGFHFPESIRNLHRSFFESGADSLAFILSHIDAPELIVWAPQNFCFESLHRVQIKSPDKTIIIKTYGSLESIPFSKACPNVLIIVHFNKYDKRTASCISAVPADTVTIEDFTQAPLDIKNAKADYCFCSLRKFVPVTVSVTYAPKMPPVTLTASESPYLKIRKAADDIKCLIEQDSSYAEEVAYLRLFELAEAQLATPRLWTAHQSQINMLRRVDFDYLLKVRRANYGFLLEALASSPMVTAIIPGDYMYFVIVTTHQKLVRERFFLHGIFPPIHWSDSDSAVSKTILSLHIDHRYDANDMNRIKQVLETFKEDQ